MLQVRNAETALNPLPAAEVAAEFSELLLPLLPLLLATVPPPRTHEYFNVQNWPQVNGPALRDLRHCTDVPPWMALAGMAYRRHSQPDDGKEPIESEQTRCQPDDFDGEQLPASTPGGSGPARQVPRLHIDALDSAALFWTYARTARPVLLEGAFSGAPGWAAHVERVVRCAEGEVARRERDGEFAADRQDCRVGEPPYCRRQPQVPLCREVCETYSYLPYLAYWPF